MKQKLREEPGGSGVNSGAGPGADDDDVVLVLEQRVAFGEQGEARLPLPRQVGPPVAERVGPLLVGDPSTWPMPAPPPHTSRPPAHPRPPARPASPSGAVPESSPRETNGAPLAGDPGERRRRRPLAPDARRVGGRPDEYEVVVHHRPRGTAEALGHEPLLARGRVGRAARRRRPGGPTPGPARCRRPPTFTSMPVCSRNFGTSTSSRPLSWVLVVVARVSVSPGPAGDAAGGSERGPRSGPAGTSTPLCHQYDHLPPHEGGGSGVLRAVEERLAPAYLDQLAVQQQPPPVGRSAGPGTGCASPRPPSSPPGCRRVTTASTRATRAGSRLAVGSSSSSTSGSEDQRPGQGHELLLPAGDRARRRTVEPAASPSAIQHPAAPRRARPASQAQAVLDVGPHRPGQSNGRWKTIVTRRSTARCRHRAGRSVAR